MLPYQFNYVEEYDVSQMNILEKFIAFSDYVYWFKVPLVIFTIIFVIGSVLILLKRSNSTLLEIGLALSVMSVLIVCSMTYIAKDEVKSIGHYEAEVKVTDIKEYDGEKYGVTRFKKGNATIDIKIANNQDISKGDDVKAMSETKAYKNHPSNKTWYFTVFAKNQNILLKEGA